MKKLFLFLIFCFFLSSCRLIEYPYNEGIYEVYANGYMKDGKQIKLSVVIDRQGKIKEVQVLDHGESPEIGEKALEELIEETENNANVVVDNISHATKTSQGYRRALEDALNKAKNK